VFALLAAALAASATPESAFAAEKRDLGGASASLAQLQRATTGFALADTAQLAGAVTQALGLEAGAGLALERTSKLPNGKDVNRFEQTFRDVPVWGERVLVTRNPDGSVERLGGSAVYNLGAAFADVTATATPNDALKLAKFAARDFKGASLAAIRDENVRKVFYITDGGTAHLAYEVSFVAQTSGPQARITRPMAIIDARTGVALERARRQ
jgi:Zn-dependent metalloprotease